MVSPAVPGEVTDFAAALAAEKKPPTPNDDLEIIGTFGFPSGTTTELTVGNLTLRKGALYLGPGGLTARGNISIQPGILAATSGALTWGGMLKISNEGVSASRFETLINISKVQGHSMTVGQNACLRLRAIDKRSISGMLVNPDKCGLVLAGEVTFSEGAVLALSFDKAGTDLALTRGEYTLVSAKKISGTVPQLKLEMMEGAPHKQRFSLRLDPTRLVLVVVD
jgi:hypothetical protein